MPCVLACDVVEEERECSEGGSGRKRRCTFFVQHLMHMFRRVHSCFVSCSEDEGVSKRSCFVTFMIIRKPYWCCKSVEVDDGDEYDS